MLGCGSVRCSSLLFRTSGGLSTSGNVRNFASVRYLVNAGTRAKVTGPMSVSSRVLIARYISTESSSAQNGPTSDATKGPTKGHTKGPAKGPKIPWSIRISRAASFSFYTALVLAGVGVSGLVVYYFISEVLLPTSDVQVFKRAFSTVEKDPEAVRLLGGGRITAYGEHSDNKWTRNRPVASRRGYDAHGKEHLLMQFHVKGDLAEGLVRLEMVQAETKSATGIGKFDFRYLVLEVPGHSRLYLIDNTNRTKPKSKERTFLGVKWGKS